MKWISKYVDPSTELQIIKKAINVIDNDQEKTIIPITNLSTILDKPIYILNRWYLWDNNTHPTENHKYFNFYKLLVNENIKKNNIKVIYLLGQENMINLKM